jgi:hypothetical protein
MDMQDKEFDNLFRSKLDDFEVSPSENVWQGIDSELGKNKYKKALLPFLSIAASVIFLVTTGILFIPAKIKHITKQAVQNNLTANKIKSVINDPVDPLTKHPVKGIEQHRMVKQIDKARNNIIANNYAALKRTRQGSSKKIINKPDQQDLVSIPKRSDAIKAAVPDEHIPLTVKSTIAESSVFITKPMIAAVQLPTTIKIEEAPVKRKHRGSTLGDLINVVVAKVDKRKDKFIEFTDNDDESNITAVNIGILKIKKDK